MSDTTTPANKVETATLAYTAFLEAKNDLDVIGFSIDEKFRVALRATLLPEIEIRTDSIDIEGETYSVELIDGSHRDYLLIKNTQETIDEKVREHLEEYLEHFSIGFISSEYSVSKDEAEHLRECGSECLYRLATRLGLIDSMIQTMLNSDGIDHFLGSYDHSHDEIDLEDLGINESYLVFRTN